MDKLKESLGPVAKHLFWIACATIVLIGMVTWFLATGSLEKLTATNKSKIDSSFNTARGISTTGTTETGGSPIHPNKKTHDATEDLIKRLKVRVGKAWAKQYNEQKGNLVWPDGLEAGVKSEVTQLLEVPVWQFEVDGQLIRIEDERDKNKAIRKLIKEHGLDKEVSELQDAGEYQPVNLPIEKAIEFDPAGATSDKELLRPELETYGRFIQEYVPTLADKIGAKWEETGRSKSSKEPAEGALPKVIWNPRNQLALFNKLTVFPGREEVNNIPTTLQMLYAQEDLWVIEALLDIIAATNAESQGNWDASVKEIDFIEFGAGTLALTGAITPVGEGFTDPGIGSDDEPATSAQPGGFGGSATTKQVPDPAERRYVDTKFQPLSASNLRESYDSKSPDLAVLSVAKRLPIRMSLVMKQTDVPEFLIACRASKLPVEIRQVRFNKTGEAAPTRGVGRTEGGTGGTDSLGGFGSVGDDPSSDPNYGGGADGGGDGGAGGGFDGFDSGSETGFDKKAEVEDNSVSSDRMPIEFYGVIYIYNPPNTDKLQVDPEFVKSLAKEEEAAATEEPPATP